MPAQPVPRPVVLCVLDGWGYREEAADNAIAQAETPVWDALWRRWPHGVLDGSGTEVGLPAGQMGNSEVGHMNLGAGRVVMQDLPRIDAAVADGSIADRPALKALIEALKKSGGTCHLMGLLSPGGVHSHQRHIAALARIVAGAGVPVVLHAFLDGRDTPPSSALGYLAEFEADMANTSGFTIGTVSGRYWAMDRDKRWDRTARAYAALVEAEGKTAASAAEAIRASYDAGETDEFVQPSVVVGYRGMADGDGLLMANFRADRVRQILTALLDPAFDGFSRGRVVHFSAAVGMCAYSEALKRVMDMLFPQPMLRNGLGEVVAAAGRTQLRIAETEKYAHVTFFLNGGEERQFDGEERILVPSPKVATYDLKPEMAASEVTDRLVEAIRSERFDLIVVNYANTDMVGHTGDMAAAKAAVEAVDASLGRMVEALEAVGGAAFITSDHGNAEQMRDAESGEPQTAHTSNLVPAILVGAPDASATLRRGRLADVAPTLLTLMDLPVPKEMTGRPLIEGSGAADEKSRAVSA